MISNRILLLFNHRNQCRLKQSAICRRLLSLLDQRDYGTRPVSGQFGKSNVKNAAKIEEIRNIGVMAHIDAGKTTLTECLLYLAGVISSVGKVDDGSTVTDFLDMERERGITIQSAAITFFWNGKRINLIDTPGHVDFTLEVERSLRVLDGAVAVLDSTAGVQAQTLTVWRQANKFGIPAVFFVNKMDKPRADFEHCIKSIRQRLGVQVVPIVVPVIVEKKVVAFIDLLKRERLPFDHENASRNKGFTRNLEEWAPISDAREKEIFSQQFEQLVSVVAENDKAFAEVLLSAEKIEEISLLELKQALRRSTLSRSLCPILCGSGLKSSASTTPVLDAVVDFLPNPQEQASNTKLTQNIPEQVNACGLIFKITHDQQHERSAGLRQLNYVRVYKGEFGGAGTRIFNASNGHTQPAHGVKIFAPVSDVLEPLGTIGEGNIAVFTGLENVRTGDTLIRPKTFHAKPSTKHFRLPGIDAPNPVFSCTVEPSAQSSIGAFERALEELAVEDPSVHFHTDPDTDQTVMSCMGELHAEVLKDRFHRNYGLDVFMGKLEVGYREIPRHRVEQSEHFTGPHGQGKEQTQWCSMTMVVQPKNVTDRGNRINMDYNFTGVEVSANEHGEQQMLDVRQDWLDAVNSGCKIALYNGPITGHPVCNVQITITEFSASGNRLPATTVSACASRCLSNALKKAEVDVVEPVMQIEVSLAADESGDTNSAVVLSELVGRRAIIISSQELLHEATIAAKIPLSETFGIARALRTASRGLASFDMKFLEYDRIADEDRVAALRNKY